MYIVFPDDSKSMQRRGLRRETELEREREREREKERENESTSVGMREIHWQKEIALKRERKK